MLYGSRELRRLENEHYVPVYLPKGRLIKICSIQAYVPFYAEAIARRSEKPNCILLSTSCCKVPGTRTLLPASQGP